MSTTPMRELATFAVDTSLRDVPSEVVERARRGLVDTLACMLGGATVAPVRALASTLHDAYGHAAIIGTPFRTAPLSAAFVGGVAGTWMDADSGGTRHPAGGRVPPVPTAHPPVHLLPALLASTADLDPISGAELLRIYLISDELGARIGNSTRLRPGIHPHGIHGTSAAAAACGLARSANPEVIAHAIELATALPLVTSLRVAMIGATVRNAYAGMGARNGMLAFQAAMDGVTAPQDAFEAVLSHGLSDALDEQRLLNRLGLDWESSRAYIKLHACARWIHPALDAAASILPPDGVHPDTIEEIEVRTFRFAAMMDNPDPPTDLAAKFSVPYCLAALVMFGAVELEAFTPTAMQRADLRQLASRVRLFDEPAYTEALPARRPTTVIIRYRGGEIATANVEGSRGDPETAFTVDELESKFLRLAGAALGSDRAARALDMLRRLPEVPDARQLVSAVSA